MFRLRDGFYRCSPWTKKRLLLWGQDYVFPLSPILVQKDSVYWRKWKKNDVNEWMNILIVLTTWSKYYLPTLKIFPWHRINVSITLHLYNFFLYDSHFCKEDPWIWGIQGDFFQVCSTNHIFSLTNPGYRYVCIYVWCSIDCLLSWKTFLHFVDRQMVIPFHLNVR